MTVRDWGCGFGGGEGSIVCFSFGGGVVGVVEALEDELLHGVLEAVLAICGEEEEGSDARLLVRDVILQGLLEALPDLLRGDGL